MSQHNRPFLILLVEDNLSDTVLVRGQLERSGFDVSLHCQDTLDAAVREVRKTKYDIILLDLTLPDSQGLATFTMLQSAAADTPIVILSGEEDSDLALRAVSQGAQDYLTKTRIDADSLIRSIRYTIERTRRQRAETELGAAGTIQRRLFPRVAPRIANCDVCGRCRPATYAGGDFFDFFSIGNDRLGIAIADAAGHGIGPAITMSETRAVIRTLATMCHDVGEILTRASTILARDLTEQTFVALFLASIDPVTPALRFATAGHPGFILNSAGRTKQLLKSDDPPLGIGGGVQFTSSSEIPLEPGDSLFLFTDGLTECVDATGAQFGRQRVFDSIREKYDADAQSMLDHLFERVTAYTHDMGRTDDITTVILKVQPEGQKVPEASTQTQPQHSPVTHEEYTYFQVDSVDDTAVIVLAEKEILSSEMCSELRSELAAYVKRVKPARMIVSFCKCELFYSDGINVCLHLQSLVDAGGAELRLCDMQPYIREAFQALNLDGKVFRIFDTVQMALR